MAQEPRHDQFKEGITGAGPSLSSSIDTPLPKQESKTSSEYTLAELLAEITERKRLSDEQQEDFRKFLEALSAAHKIKAFPKNENLSGSQNKDFADLAYALRASSSVLSNGEFTSKNGSVFVNDKQIQFVAKSDVSKKDKTRAMTLEDAIVMMTNASMNPRMLPPNKIVISDATREQKQLLQAAAHYVNQTLPAERQLKIQNPVKIMPLAYTLGRDGSQNIFNDFMGKAAYAGTAAPVAEQAESSADAELSEEALVDSAEEAIPEEPLVDSSEEVIPEEKIEEKAGIDVAEESPAPDEVAAESFANFSLSNEGNSAPSSEAEIVEALEENLQEELSAVEVGEEITEQELTAAEQETLDRLMAGAVSERPESVEYGTTENGDMVFRADLKDSNASLFFTKEDGEAPLIIRAEENGVAVFERDGYSITPKSKPDASQDIEAAIEEASDADGVSMEQIKSDIESSLAGQSMKDRGFDPIDITTEETPRPVYRVSLNGDQSVAILAVDNADGNPSVIYMDLNDDTEPFRDPLICAKEDYGHDQHPDNKEYRVTATFPESFKISDSGYTDQSAPIRETQRAADRASKAFAEKIQNEWADIAGNGKISSAGFEIVQEYTAYTSGLCDQFGFATSPLAQLGPIDLNNIDAAVATAERLAKASKATSATAIEKGRKALEQSGPALNI